MDLLAIERFGADELFDRLRRVPLVGHGGARPYADARFELVTVDPGELAPAQSYLLTGELRRTMALREALLEHGVDQLALDGGLWMTFGGEPPRRIPAIPPIVEQSREPGGRLVWLVNDGLHRVYTARELGLPVTIVRITGVPAEYPYYAYAREEGWDGFDLLDEIPPGYVKKRYRHPETHKDLFRDFGAEFPGIQPVRAAAPVSRVG